MKEPVILIEGFDVFDTVLSRTLSPPKSVFLHLGKRIVEKYNLKFSSEFFALQRRSAEGRSLKNIGTSTSIENIYDELAGTLALEDELRKRLLDEEFNFEKEVTFVIPKTRVLLEEARSRGRKVVFISDMYLQEPLLRELLSFHEVLSPKDSVYVSCDYGISKRSGKLFSKVLELEGIEPGQMLFRGNHMRSDVISARQHKIEAQHCSEANPNKYEGVLGDYSDSTCGLGSKLAGASRKARLFGASNSGQERCIRETAAGVAAPMLLSFVAWVLRKADDLEIKRLYFTSRSGQVLVEIAKVLAAKLSVGIECRPLYASRHSWIRGTSAGVIPEWVWDEVALTTTLEDFLSRISLSYNDVRSELAEFGFSSSSLMRPLSKNALKKLRVCCESEKLQAKLSLLWTEDRDLLHDYFKHECLGDPIKKGLVDIGGKDSLHEILCDFLEEENTLPIHGFFYGLEQYPSRWNNFAHGFYFDHTRKSGLPATLDQNSLLVLAEVFCTDSLRLVTGIERRSTGIVPVLEKSRARESDRMKSRHLHETVLSFVDAIDINSEEIDLIAVVRPAIHETTQLFWSSPSLLEAQTWGSFLWDTGNCSENNKVPLAQPISIGSFAKSIFPKSATLGKHPNPWLAGSKRISRFPVRHIYRGLVYSNDFFFILVKLTRRVFKALRE